MAPQIIECTRVISSFEDFSEFGVSIKFVCEFLRRKEQLVKKIDIKEAESGIQTQGHGISVRGQLSPQTMLLLKRTLLSFGG